MKNLIICGLVGTGKTTIAKKICEELNYEYIDLYDKINGKIDTKDKENASKLLAKDINKYLMNVSENKCIIDCDYLILPNEFYNCDAKVNYNIIYLGFNNVDVELLFNKFSDDYKKKNITYDSEKLRNQIEYFKYISNKVYLDCKKYNYKYFDLDKEKSLVIDEIMNFIYSIMDK